MESADREVGRALDLLRDNLGNHEIVIGQHELQEVGTETSGSERCNEDVGVQADSCHDTSLNTSSSV